MGTLEIRTAAGAMRRPLALATLLGRHLACTWRVQSPQAPLFWLELRWMRRWNWRVLASDDETRGPGRLEVGGWRALEVGNRILGPAGIALVLVDDAAPEPFVVHLNSGEPVFDEALDQVVEWRADGFFPVGTESAPDGVAALQDGQAFVGPTGQLFRFHAGHGLTSTVRSAVSVGSSELSVSLNPTPTLQMVEGGSTVELAAEFVRIAAPYLEARLQDAPIGGWLSLDEAYDRWLELGGSPDSDRNRVAQDRSRLCRSLAKQGVGAASTLFETRREASGCRTRISPDPARLYLD